MFKTEKSLCLATPAQHFFLLWDFLHRNLSWHTKFKGVLIEVSCVLQTILDGWSFYRWESKGPFFLEIASTLGENEFDLHDGSGKALKVFFGGKWQIHFDLKRIFPTNCNAHTPPFAIHLGVRTIRLANDVLHQAGSPKATKRPKNKKTTEDWTWTTRGIGGWYWFISFGRFKI